MPKHNLIVLSPQERLWLWRQRQPTRLPRSRGRRAGSMTQVEAAGALGLPVEHYGRLESGKQVTLSLPEEVRITRAVTHQSYELGDDEFCLLARKRDGRQVRDIAGELGISVVRFFTLEREADPRVVQLWRRHGYFGFRQEQAAA